LVGFNKRIIKKIASLSKLWGIVAQHFQLCLMISYITPEVWTHFENMLKSTESAKFNSPARRTRQQIRLFFQALKGRNNLFRPFRA